jgi:hypothetical protein
MYGIGGIGGPALHALNGALGLSEVADDLAAPFEANVGWELDALLDEAKESQAPPEMRNFIREYYAGPATVAPGDHRGSRPSSPQDNDQSWRRIDSDWLGLSADLAMQLDNRTNNTSLVLAFEFVKSGRVLLFAADAQVGSWLSWQNLC